MHKMLKKESFGSPSFQLKSVLTFFIKSSFSVSPKKAFYRFSAISTFAKYKQKKIWSQTLSVTSSYA